MGRLKDLSKDPGFVASCGVHALAFAALIFNFSWTPKLDPEIETVSVEMISTSDLNDIMNGEKTAKPMPKAQRRVDKVADLEDHKPLPPTVEAKKDTPPEPSPDKPNDDPGHDDKPPEPVAAVTPPPRPPEPPKPVVPPPLPPERPVAKVEPKIEPKIAPKVEPVKAPEPPKPEIEKPDAEALAPKPPPRPKPEKIAKQEPKQEPKLLPVPRPRPETVAKVEPKPEPAPEPPRRPDPKPAPKTDPLVDVASLLHSMKPPKPVTKQRAGAEIKEAKAHDDFSLDKISALLDHDTPQRKASTGKALTQLASLGSPTSHSEKMSPSVSAQLDGWLTDHYRGCWSYFGLGGTQDYVPVLRIRMAQDGSLVGQPLLINPTNDPNLRSLADSALRAVNRCNPLEIPDRFKPYYDQGYKLRTVRFNPKDLS